LVDVFAAGWQDEAAEIGAHHYLKYEINIELVRIVNEHTIEARFFERVVGETRSSGTGSCAAAVAAMDAGGAQTPVQVHTQGGTQLVRWEGEVFLTGTAHMICRGEFFI
jgi:diaminopimelate epimerase